MPLDDLRGQIDRIDHELLRLLRERAQIASEVGQFKASQGRDVYDPQREARLLERLTTDDLSPLTPEAIRAIYREIISVSRSLQRTPVIAYLGPEHTFSHLAALQHFGVSCDYRPQPAIEEIFHSVERREADFGLVPIENSIEGVVTRSLDYLVDTSLSICAETYVDVRICLLGYGTVEQIRRVLSHPQPLAQCRHWLRKHIPMAEQLPEASTSTATAAVAEARDPEVAALGTAQAAEHYGVPVLADDIQDYRNNRTRFFVLGRCHPGPTGKDKTSVLFTTLHKSGALAAALVPLSAHQINLTLIQSRPAPTGLQGPYFFYVDFDGHQDDPMVHAALEGLSENCQKIKILGSYPAAPE
ncbi:prephenate dehydratase [bacterium]|nr:prephenate dehydratase [bacterium]